jgi:hypothetical protein
MIDDFYLLFSYMSAPMLQIVKEPEGIFFFFQKEHPWLMIFHCPFRQDCFLASFHIPGTKSDKKSFVACYVSVFIFQEIHPGGYTVCIRTHTERLDRYNKSSPE